MTNRLGQELARFEPLAPDALLFTNKQHAALANPSAFLTWLRQETKLDFRFHDLRHTFFTRMQEASRHELLCRYCLGHHLRVTAGIYYHPSVESTREAMLKMEEATVNALAAYATQALSDHEEAN